MTDRTTLIDTKARFTLYFRQDMGLGYTKVEVSALTLKQGKWAQYSNAISGEYTRKRCKRSSMLPSQTFQPSLVVLEGWGHPQSPSIWDESTRKEGADVTTVQARYSSCDPRWSQDFRASLARYVETSGAKVLFDFHELQTA